MHGFITEATASDCSKTIAAKRKTAAAANWKDVLFDQLDRLIIDHNSSGHWYHCDCDFCKRYWLVNDALMQYFPTLQRKPKPQEKLLLEERKAARALEL